MRKTTMRGILLREGPEGALARYAGGGMKANIESECPAEVTVNPPSGIRNP